MYYLGFKSHKTVKTDKATQARIYDIIKKNDDRVVGFDVSHFQGKINWSEIDSIEGKPLKFVFIRATAGVSRTDSQFSQNWEQAKKHHIIRGAYHYYRPNENSIIQAKNFIKNVTLSKGDLPPVVDLEKMPATQSMDSLKVGLKRFVDAVEKHYKRKPIIYSGEKYYKDFLKDEFEGYTFWIANYNFWVDEISDDWLFWQFTEKAHINGIDEKVDINIYNGTPKMLEYLTISN